MKATAFNQKTIDEFHAKNGLGVGMWGDHLLLMTSTGAKSSESIINPLVYRREGDGYIVIASKGGAPTHPQWLANLKADPEVEVEVAKDGGTDRCKARARIIADGAGHARLYAERAMTLPGVMAYR